VTTVYLGTTDFAATVLRTLAGSAHRPSLVVTPSDSRQGRGRKLAPPPTAEAASELGIELLQVGNVNEEPARERIAAGRPRAVVVCAFGQLIREPLLSEHLMLNVHPSLLPRWRGAAPIERAIMVRDRRTGVCVMKLVAELDAGPVALRAAVPIGADTEFEALSSTLAGMGGELAVRALNLEAEGRLEFSEQDEAEVTYAEKIDPAERRLDPARSATELAAVVRALTPHIGAYLETADGERLGVRRARAVDVSVQTGALKSEWGALLVGCCRGALRLDVVQPPGGRPMAVDAYLRGHSLPKL
jgi:methionyl-tRNA formyltransferase